MQSILQAEQLTSVRGERTLFSGLDLTVDSGQLYQIEGPNGAGKSTLLRILAGLLKPQAGEIKFCAENCDQVRGEFLRDMLFIGHKAAVKPELTAIENLEFFAAVQGHPLQAPPFELLAQLGLVGLEDVPAGHLSAGQQRRIALTRLWLTSARLWILDEPFTSLDTAGIALLHKRFGEHLAAGGAIVLTSHQPLDWAGQAFVRMQLEYQW
ncbi:heme ABC transporter ATP-binding protein CcmA [Aliidiomarina minuta]|uniref:Heme ABC transporter ATP-binding protein CcmA n=1 Tax=Aliidiomarina minuta TaxID=880057 RepID=A0A432W9S0_9GAMM|nr:cytochrome c biogenesis heme-transporting ATPase CcmA [Aliidiomarina minuta]RUO26358.1 heme ABC transporter ATP-binding protein CcmA [Aliidiomarina minuta]